MVANPVGVLGRVYLRNNGVHAKLAQVLGVRGYDADHGRAVLKELDHERLAAGVPAHSVVAYRPSRCVQQFRGPQQIPPIQLPLSGFGREHRRLRKHFGGNAVAQRFKQCELVFSRHAGGGKVAVFPEGMDPRVEAVEKRLVRPFEIEHEPERFAHALVLELFAPQVEHVALAGRLVSVRKGTLHGPAVLDGGKVVGGRPLPRDVLRAERVGARLEAFEGRQRIPEILDANAVEVVAAQVDREVLAPVVGIPPVDDPAVHLELVENVRPGAGGRLEAGLVENRSGGFEPSLGKDRKAADEGGVVAGRLFCVEFEAYPVRPFDLGVLDGLGQLTPERKQAFPQEQVVAEIDVVRRERRAVRETSLGAKVERDPAPVLRVFHGLAKQAVGGADLVGRALENAFEEHGRKPAGTSLPAVGIHRIERSPCPDRDFAALGGVGVHVVQMGEIGVVFEIAERGYAVRGDEVLRACLRRQSRERSDSRRESGAPPQTGPACARRMAPAALGTLPILLHRLPRVVSLALPPDA